MRRRDSFSDIEVLSDTNESEDEPPPEKSTSKPIVLNFERDEDNATKEDVKEALAAAAPSQPSVPTLQCVIHSSYGKDAERDSNDAFQSARIEVVPVVDLPPPDAIFYMLYVVKTRNMKRMSLY